jgi:hypothetical protein
MTDVKPIQIKHTRCSDWSGSTYILAPVAWTKSEIRQKIEAARTAYLKAFDEAKRDAGPAPSYPHVITITPTLPRDMTVGDLLDRQTRDKKRYEEYQSRRRYTHRRFEDFLADEGFVPFHDEDHVDEFECDWGHRHGDQLSYGNEDEIDPVPSPAKLVGSDYDDEDF